MKNKRILYVSSELTPYLPSSRRADVSLEIPRLMQEEGAEVRIFMPRYGTINERRHQLHEVIRLSGMNLVVNDIDQPLIIKVASVPKERLQVYFIDNQEYFQGRGHEEEADGNLFPDSDERAIFFAKGVLETVKKLNWSPDIIHVSGALCYMLPLYVKTQYKDDPAFSEAKVVVSVFGEGFRGAMHPELAAKLAFDGIEEPVLGEPNYDNLTKTCLKYADAVVVDAAINEEIAAGAVKSRKLPCLKDFSESPAGCAEYSALYAEISNED